MTNQLFARELSSGAWQWSFRDQQGSWQDKQTEINDTDTASESEPVHIVLNGTQVVATEVDLKANQSKHARKLIPYELEDELSSAVEDLHFAYHHDGESTASVIYVDEGACKERINDLLNNGQEISTVLPDYLLLKRTQNELVCLLENGFLISRFDEYKGFSVELDLAQFVLARLAAAGDKIPSTIKLIAETEDQLKVLQSFLPEDWTEIDQTHQIGNFWQAIDETQVESHLNLRSGALARRLPYARWWNFWKVTSIACGAALCCAIIVNVLAYANAKSESASFREKMNEAYLKALPNGRLGDVEGILESKVKTIRVDSGESTNALYLLSQTVESAKQDENLTITSFSYNGSQRSLQLSFEFKTLDDLSGFRARLTQAGLETESPRTSSTSDGYQARMKVEELN